MSDAHQQPIAGGDLARTPFAHLVLYLYQRRSSGTLIIQSGDVDYRMLFHRGRAVAAAVPQPSAALDDSLIELSGFGSGTFEFHEADLVGSGPSVVTGMFDPFAFVVRAARTHVLEAYVEAVLSKYQGVPLVLDGSTDWSRLSLTPEELQLVAALKQAPTATMTMEVLFGQVGLPRGRARRLLYSLLIIRAVQPESASPDAGVDAAVSGNPPANRNSPAPRQSRPDTRDVRPSRGSGDAWRAIASAAAAMAEGRPPSDPNVTAVRSSRPSAPRTPSQSSPRAITRPLSQSLSKGGSGPPASPRVSGFDATPSRPLSEPLNTSPLPGRRAESRPPMPSAGAGQRDSLTGMPKAQPSTPMPRGSPRPSLPDVDTLDADGKFRRVELLCQRNGYNEALPIIRALVEQDRKSAKYLGMLAHVLFGRTTDVNFGKELVECVNQALRVDPDQVYALYTKARCYKRLGKEREALHYFRRTLGADPNHLDAAREARLLVSRLAERRKR